MQLHRDTTIQQLTITPSVRDGVIYYDDSALVLVNVNVNVKVKVKAKAKAKAK
eukprot:Pgem_evm1s13199